MNFHVSTPVAFFKSLLNSSQKFDSIFTFVLKDSGFGKKSFIIRLFLSFWLFSELLYPLHLTFNLSPFLLSTFSIINYF